MKPSRCMSADAGPFTQQLHTASFRPWPDVMNTGDPMDTPYEILLPVNTHDDRRRQRARERARERAQSLVSLAISLVACFSAAGIGALATSDAAAFYAGLTLPGWAPPASLFGPVWTVLYALMAVAAWLVWRHREESAHAIPALRLFAVQLVVNAFWSWTFFAWHLGGLAVLTIVTLLVLVVLTLRAFHRVHPPAAFLLVPYAAWVTFATALALAAWRLNPTLLG